MALGLHLRAGVKRPVRLDSVVKVKELEEERALKELGVAQKAARVAQEEARAARERVMKETRMSGTAELWELAEAAHQRARGELKVAEERFALSEKKVVKARTEHLLARNKAEAVRRVAEARREELNLEAEKKETVRLDEIAAINHWRKNR